MASATEQRYIAVAIVAAAVLMGWLFAEALLNVANAIGFVIVVALAGVLAWLIPLYRRSFLARARTHHDAQWTREEIRDAIRDQNSRELSRLMEQIPAPPEARSRQEYEADIATGKARGVLIDHGYRSGKAVPQESPKQGPLKEYRQGDWLTYLPMAAKVVDFQQWPDGQRMCVYVLETAPLEPTRKSLMTYAPQRAVAEPSVRAEFDDGPSPGLVVEEVGDDDDGFTPMGEEQAPGIIEEGGTRLATGLPPEDPDAARVVQVDPRRHKIDAARRARHDKHWLTHAEETGKLDGPDGAMLQHILAGTQNVDVAGYLQHAQQLAERANEGRLLLGRAVPDTPLSKSLVAATKTAEEGAALILAMAQDLQQVLDQRNELACRLIQAMPAALQRARAESYAEQQAEERDDHDLRGQQLVEYVLGEHDRLEGVGGHVFWTRAPVMVVQADAMAEGAQRLRVVDPVHGCLLGYVHLPHG